MILKRLMAQNAVTAKKRNGFTLVELVVVVLVLGIIAAVAAPRMFGTVDQAKESSAATLAAIVRDHINLYYAVNGAYPDTIDPASFRGPLKNPFDPDNPNFAINGGSPTYVYPSLKTLPRLYACWYNKVNGQFMVRVPVQESDAATIDLFNRVNSTAVTSLSQTN
jgi:prepilin-type N-terminal cleavage/methylation domain-containing protein